MKTGVKVLIVFAALFFFFKVMGFGTQERESAAISNSKVKDIPCTTDKFTAKLSNAYYDKGYSSPSFRGEAVVVNNCASPMTINLELSAYTQDGTVVYKNSRIITYNLTPGIEYPINLDHWVEYNPVVSYFSVKPIKVTKWNL
ncbi:hypothetical protein QOM18_06000 [Serratia marcescens]|uniref:hypothetical protein n=1 Tax=Serratia TaxID=613 RepID=UPI0012B5C8CF|nr:hypothetical protein [Serratia marcescens]MDK1707855.1 hypothetical protein [Serratia marcescens]HEI9781969.1 hypothetical protein [Serratia marcescens]